MAQLTDHERYKVLAGLVVPRPIAWITTRDEMGRVNLAPYSFFQVMATASCHIGVGISDHSDGRRKDTLRAIEATEEFVVNLCSADFAETIERSSEDLPLGVNEAEVLGVTLAPSTSTGVPRVAGASVSLECRLDRVLALNPTEAWVIARVHRAVVDDTVMDADLSVSYDRYQPLGRLIAGSYVTTERRFSVAGAGEDAAPTGH